MMKGLQLWLVVHGPRVVLALALGAVTLAGTLGLVAPEAADACLAVLRGHKQ